LVELFTSEGCSSCPPADRVLASIARDEGVTGAKVITLAFHVDYWDYIGWKDRFSSAEYSERQQKYARRFRLDSSYTPQMVVDGTTHFVGSNRIEAIGAISRSSKAAKPRVRLNLKGDVLSVSIPDIGNQSDAAVFLAVAENSLSTRVKAGENSGSTLEHASVVRELVELGEIRKGATGFGLDHVLSLDSGWKAENLVFVVFVQDKDTLKVIAADDIRR
ncbi:MAG: DUF1223 domain-containing protein, partial [Pyrinomonadaceae bacterium]